MTGYSPLPSPYWSEDQDIEKPTLKMDKQPLLDNGFQRQEIFPPTSPQPLYKQQPNRHPKAQIPTIMTLDFSSTFHHFPSYSTFTSTDFKPHNNKYHNRNDPALFEEVDIDLDDFSRSTSLSRRRGVVVLRQQLSVGLEKYREARSLRMFLLGILLFVVAVIAMKAVGVLAGRPVVEMSVETNPGSGADPEVVTRAEDACQPHPFRFCRREKWNKRH